MTADDSIIITLLCLPAAASGPRDHKGCSKHKPGFNGDRRSNSPALFLSFCTGSNRLQSLYLWLRYQIDTRGTSGSGRFPAKSVKSVTVPQDNTGEGMRKGKKALLIAAAMIFTIASLAVLNFVRSKMEANEPAANPAAARVAVSIIRAA
jgi:hypothetical protein